MNDPKPHNIEARLLAIGFLLGALVSFPFATVALLYLTRVPP